ncbi:MAG: helix-turn-helix domain-containing protein [Planctomycetes bacterium]|nr:helix-turn-helix domain-containing protein [Planctomycetota bacterium]
MAVFTEALRNEIDGSGLTLYRIAKDAGLSYSVLSRFYHGERSLTLESADKLAEYFGLEVKPKAKGKRKK